MKGLLLAVLVLLGSGNNSNVVTPVQGQIVAKQNGLITVEVMGQLENWYIDEYTESFKIDDAVYIIGDRLINLNNIK